MATATGGIITTSGGYKIHTFANVATEAFEVTSGSGNMVMSTPFADRIRQIFGDRQ